MLLLRVAALVSDCMATHTPCLVWGVIFFFFLIDMNFLYVGKTLVGFNLMHTSIAEQKKNVLLAFILGYTLVLHYPSWVLNQVTELAVCWGKPDVYCERAVVLCPGLSLKPASNSRSILLSFSLQKVECCSKMH